MDYFRKEKKRKASLTTLDFTISHTSSTSFVSTQHQNSVPLHISTMVRSLSIVLPLVMAVSTSTAWSTLPTTSFAARTSSTALPMALDYNDPIVAQEFTAVQPLSYEEVEEELMMSGVKGSPDMNDMDLKLMLVELRMRLAGKMPGQETKEEKKKPASYSSKFEEAMWEKPFFAELYDGVKSKGDHNAMNVAAEYLNDPDMAISRYGKTYKKLLSQIDEALNAKKEVTTPTITFKGFPANMGEMGCKMTLEALGEITEFECSESDDFPILEGTVTFEDIETAKKAIEQYDGMDMGMGTALELESV